VASPDPGAEVRSGERIADVKFASREDLAGLLPERLLHRIVSALDDPSEVYLEHGQSPMR
jgi:hypothetical protein